MPTEKDHKLSGEGSYLRKPNKRIKLLRDSLIPIATVLTWYGIMSVFIDIIRLPLEPVYWLALGNAVMLLWIWGFYRAEERKVKVLERKIDEYERTRPTIEKANEIFKEMSGLPGKVLKGLPSVDTMQLQKEITRANKVIASLKKRLEENNQTQKQGGER